MYPHAQGKQTQGRRQNRTAKAWKEATGSPAAKAPASIRPTGSPPPEACEIMVTKRLASQLPVEPVRQRTVKRGVRNGRPKPLIFRFLPTELLNPLNLPYVPRLPVIRVHVYFSSAFFLIASSFFICGICHRRPTFHLCVIVTPFASEEKEESGCEQKAMLTQRLQGCNVNLRQVASVLGQRHALV